MRRITSALASVVWLAASVANAESKPAKELVRFEQRVPALDEGGKARSFERQFTLYSDGKFDYLGETGEIEESHLQVIAILLAKASFALGPGPACAAPPDEAFRLITSRGQLEWETPCGAVPDASIVALRAAIELQLTVELNRPPIFVERQHVAADGTITTDVAVQRNGVFVRGGKLGVLPAAERAQLARSIDDVRYAVAADCKLAAPKSDRRLWVWPKALDYANQCAGKLDTGSMQLNQQLDRMTNGAPKLLVALEAQGGADRPWVPRVTVFADGTFVVGELAGQLSKRELAAWQKQVAASKLVLVASTGGSGACVHPPPVTYRLRTARGEVRHRACEAPPHPTVAQLETQLQAMRERDPRRERVLYLEAAPDGAPRREDVVFVDGTMLVDTESRAIDPSNASSLVGQLLTVKFAATRRGDCSVKQTRHQIEAPGFGHLQWSEPCDEPDVSVRALVHRVEVLRASAKPKK